MAGATQSAARRTRQALRLRYSADATSSPGPFYGTGQIPLTEQAETIARF